MSAVSLPEFLRFKFAKERELEDFGTPCVHERSRDCGTQVSASASRPAKEARHMDRIYDNGTNCRSAESSGMMRLIDPSLFYEDDLSSM